MGCLSRIGCITVLAVGAAAGYWLYGDRLPSVLSRAASGAAGTVTTVATQASERLDRSDGAPLLAEREAAQAGREQTIGWVPLPVPEAGPAGASARSPMSRLSGRRGPAYVSLGAAELAALIAPDVAQALPATATGRALAIVGDTVLLRAVVERRALAGDGAAPRGEVPEGALDSALRAALDAALNAAMGAALDGRDTLRVAGTLEMVRPGHARYRVRAMRLRAFELPPRVVPALLAVLRRAANRPSADSVGADVVLLSLPAVVADVRVANGRVTLYKAVQP